MQTALKFAEAVQEVGLLCRQRSRGGEGGEGGGGGGGQAVQEVELLCRRR